jgi:hypothetical protein
VSGSAAHWSKRGTYTYNKKRDWPPQWSRGAAVGRFQGSQIERSSLWKGASSLLKTWSFFPKDSFQMSVCACACVVMKRPHTSFLDVCGPPTMAIPSLPGILLSSLLAALHGIPTITTFLLISPHAFGARERTHSLAHIRKIYKCTCSGREKQKARSQYAIHLTRAANYKQPTTPAIIIFYV